MDRTILQDSVNDLRMNMYATARSLGSLAALIDIPMTADGLHVLERRIVALMSLNRDAAVLLAAADAALCRVIAKSASHSTSTPSGWPSD